MGEGTNRKWPAQHRRHKCFHLHIKTFPPVKLLVSDYHLYQFSVLSFACLTFHCNSCHHWQPHNIHGWPLYIHIQNLASKFAYLINNICLCPSSSIHGKLLITALYLTRGGTGYWWDMESCSFPFPKLSASILPFPLVSKNRFFLLFRPIYLPVFFIWSLLVSFRTLLQWLHSLPFYDHPPQTPYTVSSTSHLAKLIQLCKV